ncbi:DUF6354 family protein [Streptomyces sp. NPDC006641]|uniref:DUF6354 family protein n=1 Tax=unclassified Streptomyces TaxID=2593676 RepID=UPI003698CEBD
MAADSTPTPAVDQVWQDNDPRQDDRQVRIVELADTHALVVLHQPRNPVSSAKPGRRTRIRLDRFRPTSTGYRYIRTIAKEN